jgi:hypothetical protein
MTYFDIDLQGGHCPPFLGFSHFIGGQCPPCSSCVKQWRKCPVFVEYPSWIIACGVSLFTQAADEWLIR